MIMLTGYYTSEHQLGDKKTPIMIYGIPLNPETHQNNPMPNVRTGVAAWCSLGLLFFLSCALLCLGAWIADPVIHTMQGDPLTVSPRRAVCGLHSEVTLPGLNASSFDAPAVPNAAVVQWVWNHPLETESTNTELVPGKCKIIYGMRPSGITFLGHLSFSPKQFSRRLYLNNKSLLC